MNRILNLLFVLGLLFVCNCYGYSALERLKDEEGGYHRVKSVVDPLREQYVREAVNAGGDYIQIESFYYYSGSRYTYRSWIFSSGLLGDQDVFLRSISDPSIFWDSTVSFYELDKTDFWWLKYAVYEIIEDASVLGSTASSPAFFRFTIVVDGDYSEHADLDIFTPIFYRQNKVNSQNVHYMQLGLLLQRIS